MLLASLSSYANDDGYIINSWDYQATVHPDNTWDVTEKLFVEYLEPRHGIYRHIPRCFDRNSEEQGQLCLFRYETEIKDVTIDGYEFELSDADDQQDNLIIKIGSESETLIGAHTYTIHYTLVYPDDRITSADFLTHTVLGTDCTTSIGNFTFHIDFDKPLPADLYLLTYSGSWDTDTNELEVESYVSETSITGEAKGVAPYKGITLHAMLPEGYWQDVMHGGNSLNIIFFICFVLAAMGTLGMLLIRRRPRPLKVIEYSVPNGFTSAEVGVIIDGMADVKDLTSLIVWFASKGYLKIRELEANQLASDGKTKASSKGKDIELIKLRDLPEDAPEYQKIFWNVFFKKHDSMVLSKMGNKYEQIHKAQRALDDFFTGERTLLTGSTKLTLLLFASFFLGFMTLWTSSSVTSYEFELGMMAGFGWLLPTAFFTILRLYFSHYDMLVHNIWIYLQYLVIILCGIGEVYLFAEVLYSPANMALPLTVYVAIIATGWLFALLGGRLEVDTAYRRENMSLLLGFREFIDKSELPMLKALVDETPTLFYDILPYAVIFGLTDKWQKQFEKIGVEAPQWYESSTVGISGLKASQQLTSHINNSISKSVESISHSSSSSSSGGGSSFSGGGGGGGGVGSW